MRRLTLVLVLCACSLALADAMTPPPGLEWLTPALISGVEGIPWVGPYVVILFKYLAFLTVVLSVLVGALAGIFKAASVFAWASGFKDTAVKIDAWWKKLYPVLAYLTILGDAGPRLNGKK